MFKIKFNISIYLTIFFLSIVGCENKCESLRNTTIQTNGATVSLDDSQDTRKPLTAHNKGSDASPYNTNLPPNGTTGSPNATQGAGQPLIVLLHGLGSDASCFDILKGNLEKAYPTAKIVALKSVEGDKTFLHSIKDQADLSFEELKTLLTCPEHGVNSPILLMGHSQGGLRACAIAARNEGLDIKGIVTIASPWEGGPSVMHDPTLKPILDGFSQALFIFSPDHSIPNLLKALTDSKNQPGVKDLIPGSQFLTEISKNLHKPGIPIRAIGGTSSTNMEIPDLGLDLNLNPDTILTNLIVDSNDPEQRHDMVVPLSSQLASNISKDNKNFKCVVIQDAPHDACLVEFCSPGTKAILEHPQMFEAIKEFIDRELPEATQKRVDTKK
ncbi:MAG: alpha/beta hydrolase [Candidatus Cardinium sp.]